MNRIKKEIQVGVKLPPVTVALYKSLVAERLGYTRVSAGAAVAYLAAQGRAALFGSPTAPAIADATMAN